MSRNHKSRRLPRLKPISLLLVVGLASILSACGSSSGGGSGSNSINGQAAGNWQFTLTSTLPTPPLAGGLQGGFLLQQKDGSVNGQAVYITTLPTQTGNPICDSGSATITGKASGSTLNLTAVAGTVTYVLTGTLGSDGSGNSTLTNGTYTATPGQGSPCGAVPDSGTVSATTVPALSGSFQGFFHSSVTSLDSPVSGTLIQGANVGASSATVSGTLVFRDPATLTNDYPCLATASVTGTISGNSVLLQVFAPSGSVVGQIGQTPGSGNPPTAVVFESTSGGMVLHNPQQGGYAVATKPSCGAGDAGNLCFALGSSTACNQPITISPSSLSFFPLPLGSTSTPQTVTIANNTSSQLLGVKLQFQDNDSQAFYQPFGGDFNGVNNFSEQDTCTPNSGFTLAAAGQPGSSCTVTVTFSPQQSCPWLPAAAFGGVAPVNCPKNVTATLKVTVPTDSVDTNTVFSLTASGTGTSAVVASVPELDFGAQAVGEASPPQTVTLSNQSPNPVQILPQGTPCAFPKGFSTPLLPRPPLDPQGTPLVSGLQIAATASISGLNNSGPISGDTILHSVRYFCDTDPPPSFGGSGAPNFQISSDTCSGQVLSPAGQAGSSCTLQITFMPQPETWKSAATQLTGLDDFLELNTAWCGDANNPAEPNCEIDSGRFPVELKTNQPSSLRMTPSAAMNFGILPKGTESDPLVITLFNDPADPNATAINFVSKIVSGADYFETDNCPTTMAPNDSCQITVIWTPSIVGFDPGGITFTYNTASQSGIVQQIFMRGTGQ